MSTTEPIEVRADPPAVLDVPPAHLELAWRPLQLRDATALHALIQAIDSVDRATERHSHAEVVEMLTGSGKDLARDSLGGFDETGAMRAYALVEVRPDDARVVRAQLRGGVDPFWRGRGIGRAILAWMEGRGRQKLAESGKDLPARLAVMVEEKARDHRRLYAAAGFSPIRWYTTMRRDLSAPLPEVQTPPGIVIEPWREEVDDAVRQAHNEAFADHWGSEPQSPDSWTEHQAHFAPEWSLVAIDEAGEGREVAGYLLSARYEHDWPALGYSCGYTDVLGVRRPWRSNGLAALLLVRAMAGYRESGMDYACLRVDTANPSGAVGLYERLGYEPTYGHVLYSVEI